MREIEIKDLTAGMRTAAPVRTHSGQLIAGPDTVLNDNLISRMRFYKIQYVLIADDQQEAMVQPAQPEPPKPAPPAPEPKKKPKRESQTYSQAVKESQFFQDFQLDFAFRTNDLKSYFDQLLAGNANADYSGVVASTAAMLKPGQTTIQFFDMIHNMRSINDPIYAHCINVALIARMIGRWLHMSTEQKDLLTLCGLLHDIGKTQIPEEILNKEEKLTDEEFQLLRSHAQRSYDILKPINLDEHVKNAALMHHERCDGSGYPSKLKGGEIDDYAIIIAIADVYDAMTAARKHRAPLCPFQVIAEFEKDGLHKYKPEYILTFLKRIAATYQSNHVLLSDGRAANIILLNQNQLSKPLVQLDNGECIDLARSSLYINSII